MIGLLLRRHRLSLLAWIGGIVGLVAVAVPSYQTVYGDVEGRSIIVDQMQGSQGSKVLYGPLPDPGTLGQLATWETATYCLILGAIMATLLGVAMTRGEENAGTLELVRSAGVQPRTPVLAALAVLAIACLGLGGGIALVMGLLTYTSSELTLVGALGLGGVVGLTSFAFGVIAVACGQVRGDARSARSWALGAVGVGFAVRIGADFATGTWSDALSWITPFGWRNVESPYTEDRLWTLAVMAAACLAGAVIVAWLATRRDLGTALLAGAGSSTRGLRIRTVAGWAARSSLGTIIGWTAAIVLIGSLFGTMAEGIVTTIATDPTTAEIMREFGYEVADPVAAYFVFLALYVAILAMVCAVGLVLRWRAEEAAGSLAIELTTGIPRWRSLAARAGLAVVVSLAILAISGAVMGGIGQLLLDSGHPIDHALAAAIGEAPGVFAAVGLTTLIVAVAPRWSAVSWAIVALSGFLVVFGDFIDLPKWLVDASLLGHAPVADPGELPRWADLASPATAVLCAIGLGGIIAGAALVGRRDLRIG